MKEKKIFTGILLLVAFIIWTALIMIIDVQPIGAKGTAVGFASFNSWIHNLTGVHMALYTITDWLGLIPVSVCFWFAGIGVWQLATKKRLLKVDHDIILLGAYYILVIGCYLIFEIYTINYRPILIEGALEASYPSSTTLLVLSIMSTLTFQLRRRMKHLTGRKIVITLIEMFSLAMVAARLISGVHWCTDIVGAILLSVGLFNVYKGLVLYYDTKKNVMET